MDDSDDDYVELSSGGEDATYRDEGISNRTRTRDTGSRRQKNKHAIDSKLKGSSGGYAWEDEYHRSWDVVREDRSGGLAGAVAELVEDSKKRRIHQDTTPLQRGIIRILVLILDFSSAMAERDLRPNRYQLTLNYAIDFVTEFFDQNPISQLAIVGMRDGLAVLVSQLDGNPNEHIRILQSYRKQEPKGVPSLQNALEMARGLLYHVPSHCTKEVLLIFGALLSSDPGDIHQTIDNLVADKIRAKVIGLAAQVAICKELSLRTNFGEDGSYGVVLNEPHFRELLMESTTPLAVNKLNTSSHSSMLVQMGFPSRISETAPSLCSCHSKLTQGGYLCPRCKSKICTLPMVCPCCDLTLILSTHLARSYHHLFPLALWKEVPLTAQLASHCFSCQQQLPAVTDTSTSRYECTKCHNQFCIDCDLFCHETLHNCPGCEALAAGKDSKVKLTLRQMPRPAPSVKLKLTTN